MLRSSLILLLLLIALTGCQADNSRSRFWDYFSQLTSEKHRWDIQNNAVRDGSGLKGSIQNGVNYVGNFLGPLKSGLQKRLYEDSDGLRRLINREIQELRRKLYPYMDVAHQKISSNLDQLRSRLLPYTQELKEQVEWGAQELHVQLGPYRDGSKMEALHRLGENLENRIVLHTGRVGQVFYPLADRLLLEIHHAVEELHGNLAPHAQTSQEILSQQVQDLSRKLTRNAKDLHEKIQKNLNELKEQLVSYPKELKQKFPQGQEAALEPVAPYMEEMAAQVQREVEEFHKNTQKQIEDFTRVINMETEELQHKLSPASWDFQDSVSSVEDVQEKLDSLWKDISQSLN
ncbi:apolipo A-V [Pelobates cultripes]|uniref:Apolipoprotein A-V n=1 Tax=Pelobates cultripes TaxID=61616 RepID=A0AAD1WWU6_PELCU|nr:apolipo A-V [Pelobates cultripes]CAH2330001.1 apolipo A-V [Pelobates cultripes]